VDAETRQRVGKQVVDALKAIGYSSAGPMEFLREESGNLYFIEMNARIQVEHPVTEMVTGVDLVKSQIRVAAGERLEKVLPPIEFRGHAIECRINAEDPDTFTPSAGKVTAFRVPGGPGIRVDTACYADAVIPPYYDSLIAKLISHGHDRAEAIVRMQRALDGFVVEGVKTTIPLHKRILADPNFLAGKFDTHFLERMTAVETK
jgi:acetyl-CoA carboxylase biotin carboxylase subunit